MIELNCTYEESKKILELGYDFNRVCDMSWVKIGANGVPVLACGNSSIQWLLSNDQLYDFQVAKTKEQPTETIPIIPKAALEACLPKVIYSSIWCDLAEWRGHCLFYMEGLKPTVLLEPFNSAYEAFIWCHKNYPEELKAKFDEVMG